MTLEEMFKMYTPKEILEMVNKYRVIKHITQTEVIEKGYGYDPYPDTPAWDKF